MDYRERLAEFMRENKIVGKKIVNFNPAPDWAYGKRFYVRTNSGNYLVYFDDRTVAGIRKMPGQAIVYQSPYGGDGGEVNNK